MKLKKNWKAFEFDWPAIMVYWEFNNSSSNDQIASIYNSIHNVCYVLNDRFLLQSSLRNEL